MPRPRTVTDQYILGAAQRAMGQNGPGRLTLADVAKEAGLSPATLVQRFGSKRGLLLALWSDALAGVQTCFDVLRQAHSSPLATLTAAATEMARNTNSPDEMANHLAFLQIDLSDPEFRECMLQMSKGIEAGYRTLLDEAIAAGELSPCDTGRLARAIGALSGGSLIGWAVYRRGSAEAWVRHDLETLLAPYRRDRKRGGTRRSKARKK